MQLQNNEEVGLKNAELTIQFPDDFRFSSSQPLAVNEAHNAWSLGEIKSKASKKVKISGQLFGEIGSKKNFNAIVTYLPANFNSEFQKSQSFTMAINDSIIDLDLEIPVKVISGRLAEYKITYTNNSRAAIERVRLTLTLPDDLEVSDLNPPATGDDMIWEIDSLESRESQSISFKGVLSAEEGQMREIKTEIGYVDKNGEYNYQIGETSIIFVVNPQLILDLSVNGSTNNNNNTASFGQRLDYILSYHNESQSTIKNMSLGVDLSSKVLDWNSLVDSLGGEVGNGTIRWDKTQLKDLASIAPGDYGEILFSINVEDNIIVTNDNDINFTIISQAKATSTEVVDIEGGSLEISSNIITTRINSRLDLRAEGRYYNDEYLPVGSGPIPPQVNQMTTYQIYWYLKNNANEVSSVEVTAFLPDDVEWADNHSVSAGTLDYDSVARKVTWTINKIPPHVGQLIPELEARFAVEATPTSDDVGKLLILLGKSQVSADDSYTGEEIVKTQDLITSNLKTDPLVSGQGVVVEASSNINSNSNTNSL